MLDAAPLTTGWIEVICGPMFSGKTEELIRRLRRASIANRRVQIFKPALDTRYSPDDIVTHSNLRMPAETVDVAEDIPLRLHPECHVVGVDEANLLRGDVVQVIDSLADSGKQVIVAGLDTDYLGRPFAPIPDLLAIAESTTKILAVCVRCGAPAKHTQRIKAEGELILVGATDTYEARCRVCFQPESPVQTSLDFGPP